MNALSDQSAFATWDEQPVTMPVGVLLRAYGALGAAAYQLGQVPGEDAARVAALCDRAFDAISAATDEPAFDEDRHGS